MLVFNDAEKNTGTAVRTHASEEKKFNLVLNTRS